MHDFVHVDAVGVGLGLVVAVTASVEEDFRFFVFLGVQHVVAFLKENYLFTNSAAGACDFNLLDKTECRRKPTRFRMISPFCRSFC